MIEQFEHKTLYAGDRTEFISVLEKIIHHYTGEIFYKVRKEGVYNSGNSYIKETIISNKEYCCLKANNISELVEILKPV